MIVSACFTTPLLEPPYVALSSTSANRATAVAILDSGKTPVVSEDRSIGSVLKSLNVTELSATCVHEEVDAI